MGEWESGSANPLAGQPAWGDDGDDDMLADLDDLDIPSAPTGMVNEGHGFRLGDNASAVRAPAKDAQPWDKAQSGSGWGDTGSVAEPPQPRGSNRGQLSSDRAQSNDGQSGLRSSLVAGDALGDSTDTFENQNLEVARPQSPNAQESLTSNPFALHQPNADVKGQLPTEKGILFSTNGLPGGMDDQRALILIYTAARAVTAALGFMFIVIAFRASVDDNPSFAFDIVRSALSIAFMVFLLLSIGLSQRVMFNRHKGHASKFGTSLAVITVRRTAAERFGRMIFWPVLVGTAMLFCFLIFLYFEIFPSKDREVDIFQHHNWANLWKVSTGSMLIIALISLQEMALLVLLPTISWLSLVTYEAHMKDPVERLSILLLEEQRIQRKGATMVGSAMGQEQQEKASRRPELAQTRAARLVNRGRPPPRALLDRQMHRVEEWLAGSVRKRKLLRWGTQAIEWFMLWNLYRIHRQLEARRLGDEEQCSSSGLIGGPVATLLCTLLITAQVGYRVCCEDQHHHEVPRVVLNVGKGVPGVKSCAQYIKRKSAKSLCEVIMAEAKWARRSAFLPYVTFLVWSLGVLYVWVPWTVCYSDLHKFKDDWVFETFGTMVMLLVLLVVTLLDSVFNFLVYHRLLLIEYCVEQRGDIEDARIKSEEAQVRREILGKTFYAWKDFYSFATSTRKSNLHVDTGRGGDTL